MGRKKTNETVAAAMPPVGATLRLLRPQEVRRRFGNIANATLYDWVKKGKLPPPIKLVDGGNASGWPESIIDNLIQQRISGAQSVTETTSTASVTSAQSNPPARPVPQNSLKVTEPAVTDSVGRVSVMLRGG